MVKNTTIKVAWAVGAAFVGFSVAVTLGWLYETDLWVLRTAQKHSSDFLDGVLGVLSFPGSVEIMGATLLVLLAGLLLRGNRALAGRILVAFVVTGVLELAMKHYLPQVPLPEIGRTEDYTPLLVADYSYPYPSGHVLRGVIVLGALYLLSGKWLLRVGLLVVLVGIFTNRVYLGVHWASDAVGGALLGVAALLWAFGGKADQHFSSSAFQQENERETSVRDAASEW